MIMTHKNRQFGVGNRYNVPVLELFRKQLVAKGGRREWMLLRVSRLCSKTGQLLEPWNAFDDDHNDP
jgi:hypothetical protein